MSTPITTLSGISHSQYSSSESHHSSSVSGSFQSMLNQEWTKTSTESKSTSVAFSKHAMARAEARGIAVTPALMEQLTTSVERAQAKGATNILAFDATRAFIINVPHGRVITTMSQEEMKENIFTNIDGAVLLK